MKQAQKVIKYVAIAFGLYLAINIIGLIIFGFTMLLGIEISTNILTGNGAETIQYGETFSKDIEQLDIEISFADFEIKVGEELKVEGQINKDYKVEVENKTLKIEDTGKKWIFNSKTCNYALCNYIDCRCST